MVRFQDFLNIQQVESRLGRYFDQSIDDRILTLDLRRVEWLSTLSTSLLYSWCYEVLQRGGHVSLAAPVGSSFAAAFLRSTAFLDCLERLGVSVSSGRGGGRSLSPRKLAAFEAFPSQDAVDSYLEALRDDDQRERLLHAKTLPEFVTSGRFHAIALRELIDNTFTHANGRNSHYAAFGSNISETGSRRRHPIVSSFGGSGYVEVCVGDSGQRNLVDTIRRFVPADYEPEAIISPGTGRLDRVERSILYAFEYESTSKPELRAKRIAELVNAPETVAKRVATGLYEVASLARMYGGQLIIRTAGRLGTIRFPETSAERPVPVVGFWRSGESRALTRLKGTTIVLRVPVEGSGVERLVVPVQRELPLRHATPIIDYVGPDLAGPDDIVSVVSSIEHNLHVALAKKVVRPHAVVCLLDGLTLPSRALGALLELISGIPRRGAALLIVTDNADIVARAAEQWERIRKHIDRTAPALRQASFALAADSRSAMTLYGSTEHAEATQIGTDGSLLLSGQALGSIDELIDEARQAYLGRVLGSTEVCHSHELYLIESRYYTTKFYEVRRLIADDRMRRTLAAWLRARLEEIRPSAVVYNADFLDILLRDTFGGMPREDLPKLLLCGADSVLSVGLEAASADRASNIVVLLDVLCTGRSFLDRFLAVLPQPERVVIVTLVDARDTDTAYVPVQRTDHSVDVPVRAILRDRLTPIPDRPPDVSVRDVVIVDPVTHTPTRYPLPKKTPRDLELFLECADAHGGLLAGHFAWEGKHYLYFLSFPEVLAAVSPDLDAWLSEQGQEFAATPQVDQDKVAVLCCDEDTGLFEHVERALREFRFGRRGAITRRELEAPPVRSERPGATAWFVLPAMSSGTTLQSCLEYAGALGAGRVQVSIIVARATDPTLLFYQKVTKYGSTSARINFMLSLPLVSYHGPGQCPACELVGSLEAAIARLRPEWFELVSIVRAAVKRMEAIPILAAGSISIQVGERPVGLWWREAYVRATYERARRDVEARTTLRRLLLEDRNVWALAAAVGRAPSDGAFSESTVRSIVYAPGLIDRGCRAWVREAQPDPEVFALQLRGFAHLEPMSFKDELRAIIEKCQRTPAYFESLLVEAVRSPAVYWDALESMSEAPNPTLQQALHEYHEFVLRSGGGVLAAGVAALNELRWHLVRSSGWGMTLEMMRMALRADPSPTSLRETAERFLKEGFAEAERRLRKAASSGTAYDRLKRFRGKQLSTAWEDLAAACHKLADKAFQIPINSSNIEASLEELEHRTAHFIEELDEVALRPGPAMERIRTLASGSESISGHLSVDVAPGCPSIACCEMDFQETIFLFLENATEASSPGTQPSIQFTFRPSETGTNVLLDVSQSAPWRASTRLEGGLARARELLGHFGGTLQVPHGDAPATTSLRVRFLAWPIEGPSFLPSEVVDG